MTTRKLLLVIMAMLLPLGAMAESYDTEIDGIWYRISSSYPSEPIVTYIEVIAPTKDGSPCYGQYTGDITIPETIMGSSVLGISANAFSECIGLTSISIPNSIKSIGDGAFYGCSSLTSVTIPNSVTRIGTSVFNGCTGLSTIKFPEGLFSMGGNCFNGTLWYNNQPDGIIYTSNILYGYKGVIPEGTSIIINEGTIGIADYAFKNSKNITSVTIPNSVTLIGKGAFYGCANLRDIVFPTGITTTGTSTFQGCTALETVTIPDNITEIGASTFEDCTGLSTVIIGKNVTNIAKRAFWGCTLKDLYSYAKGDLRVCFDDPPNDSFTNYEECVLHIPSDLANSYEGSTAYSYLWGRFKVIIRIKGPVSVKCSMPSIVVKNGNIVFDCETPDVEFNYEIVANGSTTGKGNELSLKPSYIIKVYASKDGYENSEVATQAIHLKHGDVNGDGDIDIADAVRIVNHVVGKEIIP